MAGEWTQTTVGEVTDRVTKGTTPTTLGGRFVEQGISFVKVESLAEDGRILPDNLAHIDAATDALLPRSRLEQDDILFTIAGTIGRAALVPSWLLPANTNQAVAIVRPKRGVIDPRFLFYVLRDEKRVKHAQTRVVQSVQANFSLGELSSLEIPLPPLAEQKAIAAVLGALDDKIELNRRMNATLEAMARALFQSWFVDFDPVRAKLDGRPPAALDPATAALFPDSFQDSPIGPVPRGWKVERFDAHITADRGLSYKGEGLRDDRIGLPMHNLNSIYEGGGYKHDGIKHYEGEYREKHLVEPGDMIVTNTEQGFNHLLIGHAAIVPKCFGPKGIFSHHIYRVRFKPSSPFNPHYVVELFNNRRWHYWISGFSNGTTINMLPIDALEMPMLVVPPKDLVAKFTAIAQAAHDQIEDNIQQSRTLVTLRDTLLPKLLSGELSVQ
jgi:type I restriction enzyme S subunit